METRIFGNNNNFSGVTFSNTNNDGSGELQEIHLVPEPVFVLPTDGVAMMSVKSTVKGRIFMGGKDGCLYEITYQVCTPLLVTYTSHYHYTFLRYKNICSLLPDVNPL